MVFLLIDTSTERGLVAFFHQNERLFEALIPPGYQNAQNLLTYIDQGLKSLEISCSKLSFIAVGVGPGSYTGIRLAAITAKTIAFASGIPLISFCSLDGFVSKDEGAFTAVIDAKIGGVYLRSGFKEAGRVSFFQPPELISLDKAIPFMEKQQRVVTPQIQPLRNKLEAMAPTLSCLHWEERWPDPTTLGAACWERFKRNPYSEADALTLLYMRKTQAEIEKGECLS